MVQLRIREGTSRQRCPLCQDRLDEEPASCPECRTEYHRACLSELGGCATLGCSRKGSATLAPPAARPARERGWSSLASMSRHVRLERDGRVRLDIDTWREKASGCAVLLCLALSGYPLLHFLEHEQPGVFGLTVVGLIGFLIALGIYLGFDDVVLIDPRGEAIYTQRAFYGARDLTRVGGFADVHAVLLRGEKHTSDGNSWWTYDVALRLEGQPEPLRVIDPDQSETQQWLLATELASQFGVEVETIHG